ncbi:MAG: 16S rRNA (cytosine(967)-C(5))-methyltransferase RsmB, partial [Myxococcota bacterium]
VVEKILKERPDLEPDPPGTDSEKEGPRWADLVDAGGSLRLWTHRHGTDCFFASRLRRRPPRA